MKLLNPLRAFLLATLLVVLSGGQGALSQQNSGDVITFHGGFERTGEMPGPGPAPDQPIVERWRHFLGTGSTPSPAIVANVVYAAGADGILYAIDALTGHVQWHFVFGGPISSTPTVVDGVIYVGSHAKEFCAINAGSGEKEWCIQVEERIVRSSAVVVNGVVYFGASQPTIGGFELVKSFIYGLKTADGTPVTAIALNDLFTLENFTLYASPAIVGGLVIFGSLEGPLLALNTTTGAIQWKSETYSDAYLVGGTNPEDGTTLAGRTAQAAGSPVVVGKSILYLAGNIYYAVNSENGAIRDSVDISTEEYAADYGVTLAFANGTVYVPVFSGLLALTFADSGDWLHLLQDDFDFFSSPVIANGVVYAGNQNGNLYALNAATGAWLWDFNVGGKVLSSPVVTGNAVYVTSTTGYVMALGNEGSAPTGGEEPCVTQAPNGDLPPGVTPTSEPCPTAPVTPGELCVTPTPNADPPPGAASTSDICLTPTAGPTTAPTSPDVPPISPDEICVTPTPNNDPAPGESQPPMPCPTSSAGAPSGTSSPGDLPPSGPDDPCMTPAPTGDLPPGVSSTSEPCPRQMTG